MSISKVDFDAVWQRQSSALPYRNNRLHVTASNAIGLAWRYVYNAADRLVSDFDFAGRARHYFYDGAGRLAEQVNAAGDVTSYLYDRQDRVIERRTGTTIVELEYDVDGRLVAVTSPDAEVTFEYDAVDRKIAETVNGRTILTAYDGDRLMGHTMPSGRASRWFHDGRGLPVALNVDGQLITFERDSSGREIVRKIGGDLAFRQTFDSAGRLTSQHIPRSVEQTFRYNASGDVTRIGSRLFGIDAHGRILVAGTDGEKSKRYLYDRADVPAGMDGEHWKFDGILLVQADGVHFEYDSLGRMTHRSSETGRWEFVWDAEDQLVGVVTADGDRWQYRYDAFGRRVAKQLLADDGTVRQETLFAWSGDVMMEQAGAQAMSWEFWPDGSAPVIQSDDSGLMTIVTDLVGTPTHLLGDGGQRLSALRTDLWGLSHHPAPTPLRFPGQYFDAESGLHYNRFRFYDPATARYLTPDPLGLKGNPHPFGYVKNPLTQADPLGLTSCKMTQPSLEPYGRVHRPAGGLPTQSPASMSMPNRIPPAQPMPVGLTSGRPAATQPTRPARAKQSNIGAALTVNEGTSLDAVLSQLPPVPGQRDVEASRRGTTERAVDNTTAFSSPLSDADINALVAIARSSVGMEAGDSYCIALLTTMHARMFLHPTTAFNPRGVLPATRAVDDSVVGTGRFAALGDLKTWPVVSELGWEAIRRIVAARPGRSAFVRIGKPNEIGHAVFVHHGADQDIWIETLDSPVSTARPMSGLDYLSSSSPVSVALPSGVDLRARFVEADGRIIGEAEWPIGDRPSAESESIARSLVDLSGAGTGAVGREIEYPWLMFDVPHENSDDFVRIIDEVRQLVVGPTLYFTADENPSGFHLEQVGFPVSSFMWEDGILTDPEVHMRESLQARNLLRRIGRRGATLAQIFNDTQFAVDDRVRNLRLIPKLRPSREARTEEAPFRYAAEVQMSQFTVDIRMSGATTHQVWTSQNMAHDPFSLMEASMIFAGQVTGSYLAENRFASTKEASQLRGFAADAYVFTAGLAVSIAVKGNDAHGKHVMPYAIRHNPAVLRSGLMMGNIRNWLDYNSYRVEHTFALVAERHFVGSSPAEILAIGADSIHGSIQNVLQNFTRHVPMIPVSTALALGMKTVFPFLKSNPEDPNDPIAIKENRTVGGQANLRRPAPLNSTADLVTRSNEPDSIPLITEEQSNATLQHLAQLTRDARQ
uniref:RHS repeat domain-containing protein n=1 Tax=Paractinoplanes polyasparticus TaxID=2856853 RepID=UPI001C8484A5|nr:RHS repeat-associated core domain-containing protein [Actinoplanes polyasparticus]